MANGAWLFLVLFSLSEIVSAQSKSLAEKQQIVDAVGKNFNSGSVQTFDERYEGVKGSPLLSDEWADGEVHMKNGKVFDDLRIKYDLHRDEIVVKRQDGAEVIPDKNTVQSFHLDSTRTEPARHFIRIEYLPNYRKFPYNRFAEVLYEGKSTLLLVRHRKFIKANYRGGYHANRPYDSFGEVMLQYYWIDSQGRTRELKPNHKSVLRLFSDKRKLMRALIEDNTINLNRPLDIAKLVRYYDAH